MSYNEENIYDFEQEHDHEHEHEMPTSDKNNTKDVKKFLFNCIDLTSLKCTDSEESILKFTEKVNEFVDKYPDLKNVAAICVYPNMAETTSR